MLQRPELILIAALAESNRVIGRNGKVPWSIPQDLQRFKQLTSGHTVIMGRKTWEFDLEQRSLPNRRNIVITSSPQTYQTVKRVPELVFVSSWQAALSQCTGQKKVFAIGGASIYAQVLEQVDTWELTLIAGEFTGDTFFPQYQPLIGTKFHLVAQERYAGYRFETYRNQGCN